MAATQDFVICVVESETSAVCTDHSGPGGEMFLSLLLSVSHRLVSRGLAGPNQACHNTCQHNTHSNTHAHTRTRTEEESTTCV